MLVNISDVSTEIKLTLSKYDQTSALTVENKLTTICICFEHVAVLVRRTRDFMASKSRNLPNQF